MVIVEGASRHSGMLWFDGSGNLLRAQKTFNERDVPRRDLVAMRMEAWREFEALRGNRACSTTMRPYSPWSGTRTNSIVIDCGNYRFEYTNMVSETDGEKVYYFIAFNPLKDDTDARD